MRQDQFLEYLQFEKRYSQHTVGSYATDLKQFFAFLEEVYDTARIQDVNHAMVRSWVVALMDNGLSPRSVNRKLSTLKTYYRFLRREGVVAENPMAKVQSPKVAKRLPEFVEEKRMERLLDDVEFEQDYNGRRDQLILELLYATGIRVSELVGLRDADVDFGRQTLKVLGKRNKERILPVPPALLTLIEKYLDLKESDSQMSTGEYLLVKDSGEKLTRGFVYRIVNRYLGMVTTAKKRSPHVLRHTFATHMLNEGADLNAIKELLGHANLSATQVYTHNTIEKLKNIHKQAHPEG